MAQCKPFSFKMKTGVRVMVNARGRIGLVVVMVKVWLSFQEMNGNDVPTVHRNKHLFVCVSTLERICVCGVFIFFFVFFLILQVVTFRLTFYSR